MTSLSNFFLLKISDVRLICPLADVYRAGNLTIGAGALLSGRQNIPQLGMSISVLGKYFNNEPVFIGEGRSGFRDKEDATRSIRGLIDTSAGLATEDATQAFETLISDPAVREWHDHLLHSQVIHSRNLQDAQFDRQSTTCSSRRTRRRRCVRPSPPPYPRRSGTSTSPACAARRR